jgi:hypothetical protein
MEKTKHTPGPWESKKTGYVMADNCYVAEILCGPDSPDPHEGKANGRLIASAPDLLEAAKILISSLVWERKRSGITYAGAEILEAAIDKAEGKEEV